MQARTRIKFCGLTRMRDIVYALELGVDEVGLVFAGGPRSMTVDRALPLIRRVYKETAKRPLVTMLLMNQSAKEIASLIEVLEPEQLQFHGQESMHFCDQFNLPWTKAIAAGDNQDLGNVIDQWQEQKGQYGPRAVILDAHRKGEAGGQGQTFDWQRIPQRPSLPVYIAGGLTPDNVADVVRHYHPYAVDVSSGIEDSPGIKSHEKMRTFVAEVNNVQE